MVVSQVVIDHCNKHKACKECPLVSCGPAPLCDVTDPKWQQWLDSVEVKIKQLDKQRCVDIYMKYHVSQLRHLPDKTQNEWLAGQRIYNENKPEV